VRRVKQVELPSNGKRVHGATLDLHVRAKPWRRSPDRLQSLTETKDR
jgi:hypothetical protein